MNYGELKTLVKQYLECEETTFSANIGQFVRMAEDDIFRQVQLPDLVQTSTSFCTPATNIVGLPTDYLSTYYLAVTDTDGNRQMMTSKDHSFIREVYGTSETGLPRHFAQFNDVALIIGPKPDASYAIELNYFYKPVSLAAGADSGTTWLSTNAEAALLYGTIIQGYIYLKGDQDVMKQYSEQYTQAIAELKIIAEGRNRKDTYRKSDRRMAT